MFKNLSVQKISLSVRHKKGLSVGGYSLGTTLLLFHRLSQISPLLCQDVLSALYIRMSPEIPTMTLCDAKMASRCSNDVISGMRRSSVMSICHQGWQDVTSNVYKSPALSIENWKWKSPRETGYCWAWGKYWCKLYLRQYLLNFFFADFFLFEEFVFI